MHVSIVGKSATGYLCPFDADEVWGVNNVASQPEMAGKKFTKLFAFDFLSKEYVDGMKKFAPVMSWQPYKDIDYPLNEVLAEFNSRYFTNTISYMLAYAIFLKVKKLSIYGVDMTFGAPYAQENRGIEYWIGRAQERGIEILCPPSSHILRTVYGNLYGEVNGCNMQLYLYERLNLINMLPKSGHYGDSLKAQNAWWVLYPKEDEAKEHGLKVQKDPAGNINFQADKEYSMDIQMPPEVWQYLRENLINLEKKGELPFGLVSAYEKIVLGKESTE